MDHAEGKSETLASSCAWTHARSPALMSRETEYRLPPRPTRRVPVAKVHLMGDDSLGAPGFLMERIEGETIARRLLRDDAYAEARKVMTAQLGAILARIHAVPIEKHSLETLPARARPLLSRNRAR
jgi:aminoglycoside phosphotransferase (APT) family kinase protein